MTERAAQTIAATEDTYAEGTAGRAAVVALLQRQDLTPLEEARAFQNALDATAWSGRDLARKIRKTQATVSRSLQLLRVADPVREALERRDEPLSAKAARETLRLKNHPELVAELDLGAGQRIEDVRRQIDALLAARPHRPRVTSERTRISRSLAALHRDRTRILLAMVSADRIGSELAYHQHHDKLDRVEAAMRDADRELANLPSTNCVYFIRGSSGIKIGTSHDPNLRMTDLQTGSSEPLAMLAVVSGGRAREREIHRQLKQFHLHGEWFADVEEVRAFAARLDGTE